MEIAIGMKGAASTLVEREDTAMEVGSGSLLVYATPCMTALMEGAACDAIEGALEAGTTTVGTELNIQHCQLRRWAWKSARKLRSPPWTEK